LVEKPLLSRATGIVTSYPEIPLVLTGMFSLWVLVWFLEAGKRVSLLGAVRFEFLLGGLLGAIAVASIANRDESNDSGLTKYIIAYFVFLLLHLPLSQAFYLSWPYFIDRIVKFGCMALFIYAFVRNPFTLRVFVAVFLLACMKLGQEAFLGKLTGSMVWENQGIMRLNGAPGTMFGHPNSLSGMAVGTLPFLYYLWPIVTRRWRMALLVLLLFAINIIVFTGSRTGYLGTAGLLLFFYARSSVKSRFVVVGLLVLLVGLPFVPEQYSERFMSSFTGQEREGASKQERLEIINDAWEVFKQNPQGVGIYAFLDARSRILGKYPMDTHNLYLQLLADLGIGGALVFGALIIALCSGLLSTERTVNAAVSAAAYIGIRDL
jgi:O-antigen ligase